MQYNQLHNKVHKNTQYNLMEYHHQYTQGQDNHSNNQKHNIKIINYKQDNSQLTSKHPSKPYTTSPFG